MDLLRLEQQRLALEDNLQKLRQSLKHWQLWEAEYEGLKEELTAAGPDVDGDGLNKIASTYGGDLVNEKEILQLTGLDKNCPRSAETVISLIERRQEYVQKNIETVQRQFFDAEAKQEELAFAAASTHSGAEQAGLPLTEIHEELDEEGNVVSSRLSQPEETTAKVVESLRQAGLSDVDVEGVAKTRSRRASEELKPAITNALPSIPVSSSPVLVDEEKRGHSEPAQIDAASDGSHDEAERPTIRKKSVSFTADTKEATERPRSLSRDGKKTVSFNEKVAVMPAAPPPDNRSVSFSSEVEEIPPQHQGPPTPDVKPMSQGEIETARALMAPVTQPTDAGAEDVATTTEFAIPEDEPPEDAQLRREMLDYHLNEVGNVVAQMDIDDIDTYTDDEDDDNLSFHTTSEYPEEDDTPYTTGLSEDEDDDSEDEMGRSKHTQITPEYRKQMEELQKRLIGNLGPAPQDEEIVDADPELDPQDVRKLVIRDKRNSSSSNADSESSEKRTGIKKRVSFAEELDVATPGSPPLKAQKVESPGENGRPVAETVMERNAGTASSSTAPAPTTKESKFKRNRAVPPTSSSMQPEPDNHTPLRTALFERTPATTNPAAPSLEDDPDTITARRELAEAYYSKRNEMIRRQGGFKADAEDDEDGAMMEEGEDGKVKKVSRFMAARIRGS